MWSDEQKSEQKLLCIIPKVPEWLSQNEKNDIMRLPNITKNEIAQINASFKNYIFYHRKSNGICDCFCSHCNTAFQTDYDYSGSIRHNGFMDCPHCGYEGILKSCGYSQKNLTEHLQFCIFKQLNDIVYILALAVDKIYNGDKYSWKNSYWSNTSFQRMPDLYAEVSKLYVLKKGTSSVYTSRYSYTSHGSTVVYDKLKKPFSAAFPASRGFGWSITYPSTIYINKDIIKKSFLKYSAVEITNYEEERYLTAYAQYPILEIVQKMHLRQFIEPLLYSNVKNTAIVDWSAKSPKKFFRHLDKAEVDYVINNKVGTDTIKIYQKYKRANNKKSWDFCNLQHNALNNYYRKFYKKVFIKYDFAFEDLYKYLKRQKKNYESDSHLYLNAVFKDYIQTGEKIGYDFTNRNTLFPRDIKQSHDNAIATFNFIEKERRLQDRLQEQLDKCQKANEAYFEGRYKKLVKKFSKFQYPGLVLVVPPDCQSIIKEGVELEHCVGGYAERHCTGKTTILFIRKPESVDKSYFTIEINNNNEIQQCHG